MNINIPPLPSPLQLTQFYVCRILCLLLYIHSAIDSAYECFQDGIASGSCSVLSDIIQYIEDSVHRPVTLIV